MNYRLLSKMLGLLFLLLGSTMVACLLYAYLNEPSLPGLDSIESFWISISITASAGGLLVLLGRKGGKNIMRREAIAIVGLGWLLCAFFGSLPYIFGRPSLPPAAAYFEAMSGFTTTGASAMTDITQFPKSIILWRSVTQWLGGMGILVLFVALLTYLGVSSKGLFRHESSAKDTEGLQARIRDVALRLWQIYLGLTVLCTLGLVGLGMSFFDAVNHTFTALSTGGFGTRNESIAAFNSPWIELWLVLFMTLGGASFMLYAWLLRGRWERWAKEEEAKLYLLIIGLATICIAVNLPSSGAGYGSFWHALRAALFQVVSIMTTTGFFSEDFDRWPTFSKIILLLLMFIGGCTGSTAGGIKVSRCLLFMKMLRVSVINAFRPNQVIGVQLNGTPADDQLKIQALLFIVISGVTVGLATLLLALLEPKLNLESSLSAVAATLFNVGPGFGAVGPTQNYGPLAPPSHLLLSLMMVLGRLEFFAVLVLFFPSLWRRY